MTTTLDTAKRIERDQSTTTHVTIRLALLQDLIAEIEQLQTGRPLHVVRGKAEEREGGKP